MNTVVRLAIDAPRLQGPWTVALDDLGDDRLAETLDPQEASRIVNLVRRAMAPSNGRKGPSATVGQAMARLVAARPSLSKQLPFLLGPVTGRRGRPALVIDAEGELAHWPWELFSGSPEQAPLEHTRRASIAGTLKRPVVRARELGRVTTLLQRRVRQE